MAEQLRFLNLGIRSDNIRVMGMLQDGVIFEGITKKVVCRVNTTPSILTVEGTSYNGINDKYFIEDLPLERLKIYDTDEFFKSRTLLENYITAIKDADNCRKQCRRLLA